jgi:hypothetical protein
MMLRILMAFMIVVFSVGATNASSLLNCCPKEPAPTQLSESSPPCHDSDNSSPKAPEKKAAGCLCTYTCIPQISVNEIILSEDVMHINIIPIVWADDAFLSRVIRPESPPPKA